MMNSSIASRNKSHARTEQVTVSNKRQMLIKCDTFS